VVLNEVLAYIDAEIARLQQARALLAEVDGIVPPSLPTLQKTSPAAVSGKRKLTPEGRKAIADAMKRRWARHRKQATA
jgi:hypothetical protein